MTCTKNTRKSSGIACCRFNTRTNRLEILLIKKRYTYNFVSFVFGQYNKCDEKRLKFLFNGMTSQEKNDILSLKFDMLWYKIWLEFPDSSVDTHKKFDVSTVSAIRDTWEMLHQYNSNGSGVYNIDNINKLEFYTKKKNKFNSTFTSDNGKRLKSLICNTKNSELIWEIPKGRRNNTETVIECATREFKEETCIDLDMYNIMFNVRPVVESYISANIKYIHTYHLAYTTKMFEPVDIFIHSNHASEIDAIRWVNLNEIKFINHSGRIYKLVQRIFRIFKSTYTHRIDL